MIYRARLSVPCGKRVATDDGRGWKTIPDGTISGDLVIEINLDRIAQHLGEKALRNRRGKSIGLGGLVKVRAENRTRKSDV